MTAGMKQEKRADRDRPDETVQEMRKEGAPANLSGARGGMAVALAVFVAASLVAGNVLGLGPALHWFGDTDDFTRALRVLQLMDGGAWWSPVLEGVGREGLVLHWTRPSDLLVLIGALPLHWLGLEGQRAIEVFSYVQPLILAGLMCLAWEWATRPFAARVGAGAVWGFGIILMLPAIGWFSPMRIDHHGAILVMTVLLFGYSIRCGFAALGRGEAVVAGIAAGFSLWLSVELLLFVGCFLACLGAGWAMRGGRKDAASGLLASLSLSLASFLALLVERGPGAFAADAAMEIDRLSLFHVLLVFAATAGFFLLFLISRRRFLNGKAATGLAWRMAAGMVAAGISGIVVVLVHPQVLSGHVATAVDPVYVALRSGFIREGLEIVSPAVFTQGGILALLRGMIGDLLPAVIGGCVIVVSGVSFLWRYRKSEMLGAWIWTAPFLWSVLFLAWQGWPTNANAVWLSLFGIAPSVVAAWHLSGMIWARLPGARLTGSGKRRREILACLLLVCITIAGISAASPDAAAVKANKAAVLKEADRERKGRCDRRVAIETLELAGIGPEDILMAYPDFGPAAMWRTGTNVLSIPNHRVQPGFAQSWKAFTAGTDEEARVAVEESGASHILLCDGYAARPFYGLLPKDGNSFGKRLLARQAPDWLREVAIEDPAGADLRIFVVRRGNERDEPAQYSE